MNLPPGDVKTDQFFGKMETYPRPVKAELTLTRAHKTKDFTLIATYQGYIANWASAIRPSRRW